MSQALMNLMIYKLKDQHHKESLGRRYFWSSVIMMVYNLVVRKEKYEVNNSDWCCTLQSDGLVLDLVILFMNLRENTNDLCVSLYWKARMNLYLLFYVCVMDLVKWTGSASIIEIYWGWTTGVSPSFGVTILLITLYHSSLLILENFLHTKFRVNLIRGLVHEKLWYSIGTQLLPMLLDIIYSHWYFVG